MATAPGTTTTSDSHRPDLTDELWTLAHLGRYLHCGRSTVFVIVSDPSFPSALAIRRSRSRRLWLAYEVRAWVAARPRQQAAPTVASPS